VASRVAIYHIPNHKRSTIIAKAMARGLQMCGEQFQVIESDRFRGAEAKIAVFYGFDATMRNIFREYREQQKDVVYVDLGYFGRREGGRWVGYHKVSVNGRHPTAYFQKRVHSSDRFGRFDLKFPAWNRGGSHVLVCGTSDKGAIVDGFQPQEWETRTINLLKKVTDRKIIYRPKPSWLAATPIPGAEFHQSKDDISGWLKDCWAVFSHHSNVCVDAFLHGVPNFTTDGVGLPLSESNFEKVESPRYPDSREQFGNDVAYTQFSIAEMQDGTCWRTLKAEGLI
jgi:hypothetical protein